MRIDHASGVLLAHIDLPEELIPILAALAVALVTWAIWAAFRRPDRGTVVRANAPFCPCGMAARWMLPQDQWHCDRCNQPVVPAAASPPPLAQPPRGPFCPACGSPGRWIPDSSAWGCDRCRVLLPPPAA